jgi:thioredoxin 1
MYKNYSELGNQEDVNRDEYDVLDLKSAEQKNQVISENRLVCIDVYAKWCGPCVQTSSAYSMLAKQYNRPGLCLLVKENYEAKLSGNIAGLPTYFFVRDGTLVDKVIGADLNEVEAVLKKHLNEIENTPVQGPSYNRSSVRTHRPNNIQADTRYY